jgi:xanthine/uracil permease
LRIVWWFCQTVRPFGWMRRMGQQLALCSPLLFGALVGWVLAGCLNRWGSDFQFSWNLTWISFIKFKHFEIIRFGLNLIWFIKLCFKHFHFDLV